MIEFMVIAAPRSGTAWASAWLNTADTVCLHDPLWAFHYEDLERYQTRKTLGISCTGMVHFPDWLNRHHARKVIVHRPLHEIRASCVRMGMPELPETTPAALHRVKGLHVNWLDLFDTPKAGRIWRHLLPDLSFDEERHRHLATLNIQRDLSKVEVNREASKRLLEELRSAIA